MRKLLALLLLAAPAFATNYQISTNTQQDTALTRAINRANKETCFAQNLAIGCTQAQARKAFCTRMRYGAVADCPGALAIDVFADVPTFLQREVVRIVRDEYGAKDATEAKATFDATLKDATKAKKDAACLALGLAAGCIP